MFRGEENHAEFPADLVSRKLMDKNAYRTYKYYNVITLMTIMSALLPSIFEFLFRFLQVVDTIEEAVDYIFETECIS